MGSFSLIHWIILGLFLLLLFGGNRFSNMMKDVAKGMKSFKEGMTDEEDDARKRHEDKRNDPPRSIGRQDQPIDVTPRSADPTSPPPRDDEAR